MEVISIHAPRTGSDPAVEAVEVSHHGFQSTLPARGATIAQQQENQKQIISIHAPRTGSDALNAYGITETKAFQSTLPARGATYRAKTTAARMKHFNPRSPHGERLGSLAMQLEYL